MKLKKYVQSPHLQSFNKNQKEAIIPIGSSYKDHQMGEFPTKL